VARTTGASIRDNGPMGKAPPLNAHLPLPWQHRGQGVREPRHCTAAHNIFDNMLVSIPYQLLTEIFFLILFVLL
jgi:hypothetical protein